MLCQDTRPVLSRPDFLVPSRDFLIGIESKGNGRDENLQICLYMTESTRECQKAKRIGTEILILGAFVALSKPFFTILSCELSFAFYQIPSQPVSVFSNRISICPVPPKTCLDTTLESHQHYHLQTFHKENCTVTSRSLLLLGHILIKWLATAWQGHPTRP